MNCLNFFSISCLLFNAVFLGSGIRYEPTWESLDTRPLPQWYDDAKIGILLHWGVYSVPSFESEWFWSKWKENSSSHVEFMNSNYPPGFTYQAFARDFKAELFDPEAWADLFKKAGAKYVVLTSKHYEGYTLWPSTYSFGWNAKDVGPNRDLVGDLANAIRSKTDLKFGLQYSLYEWFNPMYLVDKANNLQTNVFVNNKVIPELLEVVSKYHPEIVWANGGMEKPTYWQSTEFLAWLYNDSPVKNTVVVNDRWGADVECKHGDFYTCSTPGIWQSHKWENPLTIDKLSWGYRRNANIEDYHTTRELLVIMAETISRGGNLLINIGPTSDGRIIPIFQDRLLEIGEWLSINGEAIYNSRPWSYHNEINTNVWYTQTDSAVYAIVLDWPNGNKLELERVKNLFENNSTIVTLLGNNKLEWKKNAESISLSLPDKATVKSRWAWVLKIEPDISRMPLELILYN